VRVERMQITALYEEFLINRHQSEKETWNSIKILIFIVFLVPRRGADIKLNICYKIQYFITILFINM